MICGCNCITQEAERSKLRSELALMKKTEEIRGLESMCEQYREEIKKVCDLGSMIINGTSFY